MAYTLRVFVELLVCLFASMCLVTVVSAESLRALQSDSTPSNETALYEDGNDNSYRQLALTASAAVVTNVFHVLRRSLVAVPRRCCVCGSSSEYEG